MPRPWAGSLLVGPDAVARLQQRVVAIARAAHVVTGRKMRVDTTVVETNIHYPTDSSLLGDGVRVLTRVMKQVTGIAGTAGTTLRDRTRSVKLRVLAIARAKSSERKRPGEGEAEGAPTRRCSRRRGGSWGRPRGFVADLAQPG